MGGGSENKTGAPYDLMGGQYASFSGGTPSGINWGGVLGDVGQGFSNFGNAMASSQQPIPQFQSPDLPYGMQQQQASQPTTIQPDPQLQMTLDAISRLIGGY